MADGLNLSDFAVSLQGGQVSQLVSQAPQPAGMHVAARLSDPQHQPGIIQVKQEPLGEPDHHRIPIASLMAKSHQSHTRRAVVGGRPVDQAEGPGLEWLFLRSHAESGEITGTKAALRKGL